MAQGLRNLEGLPASTAFYTIIDHNYCENYCAMNCPLDVNCNLYS